MQFGMYMMLSAIMFRLRISVRQYIQPLPCPTSRGRVATMSASSDGLTDGCADGSSRNHESHSATQTRPARPKVTNTPRHDMTLSMPGHRPISPPPTMNAGVNPATR